MIYGSIKSIERYALPDNLLKALTEIQGYSVSNYSVGKKVIDGDNVFLNLFEYDTKDPTDAMMEAHRKYIDVMYVVNGEETVYVKDTSSLSKVTKEYEEDGDYLLGVLDEDTSAIKLYPGMFLVLFPEDAHAPGCNTCCSHAVKKIVGKAKI